VSTQRHFGISTHLFHADRLRREHLHTIAAHGFTTVELFATRSHLDYHNPSVVADFQMWLGEAGLVLHGIHAPIWTSFDGVKPDGMLSLANSDPAARARAVAEVETALHIARRIPVAVLVVHLGTPRSGNPVLTDNSRDAARRSVDELQALAEPLGVRIALEVIPNELSRANSLVHFIEEEIDGGQAGICLDFGHAHMDGDLVDAIETVSGHLITTHVHDNRGRTDDHLAPFEGTIDWPAALTAIQKVGYDGTLLFEVAAHGSPKEMLQKAQKARQRIDSMLEI